MKKIVSVSLGSSKRDHSVRIKLLGQELEVSRIGADGDFEKAKALLSKFDGQVDAIGLGGIDIYLFSNTKRYELVDGAKLRDVVKLTPVVDGSGLKNTLEPEAIRFLAAEPRFQLSEKTVLMVSAVDRYGMARAFVDAGSSMIFGDLIFALNIKAPVYTLDKLEKLADELLPKMVKAPFHTLYPIGSEQDAEPDPKFSEYYDAADIIAGDFHYIRRYMPARMEGKIIVTNTVTEKDVAELTRRNVSFLVTTTPIFEGRSFGTNVLEAVFLALIDKTPDTITSDDYMDLLQRLDYKPTITQLKSDSSS